MPLQAAAMLAEKVEAIADILEVSRQKWLDMKLPKLRQADHKAWKRRSQASVWEDDLAHLQVRTHCIFQLSTDASRSACARQAAHGHILCLEFAWDSGKVQAVKVALQALKAHVHLPLMCVALTPRKKCKSVHGFVG